MKTGCLAGAVPVGGGYTAPARYVLTELHRAAPDAGDEPVTVCGTPMLAGEVWLPVDRRPGDRVCAGCEPGGTPGGAAGEKAAGLLW